MNRNNKKYKWCTSYNNGNGAWGFHWKDGHEDWKNNQGKIVYFHFANYTTNNLLILTHYYHLGFKGRRRRRRGL